jgi:hypothetical protein
MLRTETPRAWATVGTAMFRIVVSSDSMKNATATSHGRTCFAAVEGAVGEVGATGTGF